MREDQRLDRLRDNESKRRRDADRTVDDFEKRERDRLAEFREKFLGLVKVSGLRVSIESSITADGLRETFVSRRIRKTNGCRTLINIKLEGGLRFAKAIALVHLGYFDLITTVRKRKDSLRKK